MRSFSYAAIVVAVLLAGCPGRENVQCAEDTDCDLSTGGVCTLASTGSKWCAYPDPQCPTGMRFSDQDVGDGLGGTCTDGPALVKYTLTVQVGGNGTGNVSSDPAGLTCSSGTGTCMGEFTQGTLVQLLATATQGSFLGWDNACRGPGACMVTMDKNQMVGALFGTPGEALWVKQVGTPGGEFGRGIAVDADDNLIAVGEFSQAIAPAGTDLTSAGGKDIYVVKLASATGAVLWAKRFGGTGDDIGFAVAVDAAKNIYVTGRFQGTVDFGGGPLTVAGQSDIFALKLDTNGNFGWTRRFGGTNFDVGHAIAARGTSVAVAGFFNGSVTVDTTTLTSAGSADIFVIDMATANGATTWVKSFGGTFSDLANGVTIDSTGNVALTGQFAGTVNFGGGAMSTPGDFANVFLLKLAAANGAHLFSKQLGGGDHDNGAAITVDASDNIFLIGDFRGTNADFGCATGLTASQTNLTDVFLAKYSQAGACQWAKGFGGTGTFDRRGFGVTVNSGGDVAATGWFCGSMSFGGPMLTSASACAASDVFAARFTGDGMHLNSVRAGGTGSELGMGIAQSTDGRFFVTGGFQGFAEFGGDTLTSAGGDDAFILGLAPL